LNIADRFSISTLIEPIRLEMRLSDSGVAFLTGVALALFYVTVGIPIATLADRVSRRNILVLALLVWSGMTTFCGLAQNYWQLLLARFGVGIGEAGGTPPSTSMLADTFPAVRRPMAQTLMRFEIWASSSPMRRRGLARVNLNHYASRHAAVRDSRYDQARGGKIRECRADRFKHDDVIAAYASGCSPAR
jgi:Major Facilitator Superfamily